MPRTRARWRPTTGFSILAVGFAAGMAPRCKSLQTAFEAAKARRTGERFKFRIAFFLRERESCPGIATLGGLVADIKYDGSALAAGVPSGRERMLQQRLHQ